MKRLSFILTLPVLVTLAGTGTVAVAKTKKPRNPAPTQTQPATGGTSGTTTSGTTTGTTTTGTATGTTNTAIVNPAANNPDLDPQNDTMQGILFPYSLYDYALINHVDHNGNVDYAGLKGNQFLDRFVKAVAGADVSQFPVFKNEVKTDDKHTGRETTKIVEDHSPELAFWINAYNANVLKTLADAYPLDGPENIKGFDTAKTHTVAGKTWSLAELRAKIAQLDPRALFALTDGTRGGPLLAPDAYRFSCGQGCYLSDELNRAVQVFVNDDRNVALLRIQNQVTVNPYLAEVDQWFKPKGARRKWDGIRAILAGYRKTSQAYFAAGDYNVQFAQPDRHLSTKSE